MGKRRNDLIDFTGFLFFSRGKMLCGLVQLTSSCSFFVCLELLLSFKSVLTSFPLSKLYNKNPRVAQLIPRQMWCCKHECSISLFKKNGGGENESPQYYSFCPLVNKEGEPSVFPPQSCVLYEYMRNSRGYSCSRNT